jgi:hypothetical protein
MSWFSDVEEDHTKATPLYLLTFLSPHYLSFIFVALGPNAGHGLLSLEVSRTHTTTHHS